MKLIRNFAHIFLIVAVMVVPAIAQTNISSPANNAQVSTTFTLNMNASSCSSLPVAAVGYSLDDSSDTSAWQANYINGPVGSPTGWHTLHVKVWNNQGGICVTDVPIDVVDGGGSGGGGSSISSPANGSAVSSPFTLAANEGSCSGQSVVAIGYSVDDSSYTAVVQGQAINTSVNAGSGWHTVHVKYWDGSGDVCVNDVSVNVTGGASSSGASASSSGSSNAMSVVPSYATQVSSIQTLQDWTTVHDGGTPGWSSGTMSITGSPSLSGSALLLANEFNDYGGQRYAAQFSDDQYAQNFFYDTWVYIANDASGFSNLEFDLNQTMPNGETVIMGFQCDSWNNTWDYTINGGSPDNSWDTWQHSYAQCNVHNWGANQWHHVQIYFSHDENGWVTYHSVWLDGNEQDLGFNVFSGFNLGWSPAIVTNFQVDGSSSDTTWGNIYVDNMTVYRW